MNIEKIVMMKPFLAMAMFTALLCLTLNGLSAQQPLIIPQPQTMQVTAGTFGINKSIVIAADHSFTEEAKFLADTLKQTADVNAAYNSKGPLHPGSKNRHQRRGVHARSPVESNRHQSQF